MHEWLSAYSAILIFDVSLTSPLFIVHTVSRRRSNLPLISQVHVIKVH